MNDDFPACVPEFSDGVVLLRAHREEDLPRVVVQCRDADSLRFTTVPRPYDDRDARSWLAAIRDGWSAPPPTTWHWAITAADDADARYLGTIDLRPTGGGSAETGYGMHPGGRGRGLMARALRLLQGYVAARPELGIDVIRWRAVVGNWASRRVAWACGFTHEGTQRALLRQPLIDGSSRRDVDGWVASWRVGEPTTAARPWYDVPELAVPGLAVGGVLPRPSTDLPPGMLGVRLRPWREEDGAALPEALDEAAARFLPRVVPTRATYDAFLLDRREREASGTGVAWAIVGAAAEGTSATGDIRAFGLDERMYRDDAEIGYTLHAGARRRGLASAAARALADYLLTPAEDGGYGLRRVTAITAPENRASQKVLTAAGLRRWFVDPQVVAPLSPTSDRWRYGRLTDAEPGQPG